MQVEWVHSIVLELRAQYDTVVPRDMGRQVHGLFLNLLRQLDPVLSARLHDEPGYRPYTLSPLSGIRFSGASGVLHAGQSYRLRVTLLDGGAILRLLQTHPFLDGPIAVQLGKARLYLTHILTTPDADAGGWVNAVDWATLAALPPQQSITISFITPTAFSMGERVFRLFPEPAWVWESALRDWNRYAPQQFRFEKSTVREAVERYVSIAGGGEIFTETLHFSGDERHPGFVQKGFLGTCTYMLQEGESAPFLTTLAAFAFYAGVGYKTTMGMGQVRVVLGEGIPSKKVALSHPLRIKGSEEVRSRKEKAGSLFPSLY